MGAATSGITFYDADAFPAEYRGALFFADLARRCLFVMTAAADGLPDPHTVRLFERPVSIVDLVVGPDGALYYADINHGGLRRISYR